MPGVLEHLTVLDLSRGVAGPLSTMLLADQGARVIKIEPPGGDPTRALSGSRVWHRGKESATLDLKSAVDREHFLHLVERTDVLVESSSAGAMNRLGLAFDDLHPLNPRLIYCSISGYGDCHGHAGRSAYDALVAARTGLQWEKRGWPGGSIEHMNHVEPFLPDLEIPADEIEGPPRPGPLFSSVPWPSLSAFYLASMGISAALHVREETGRGQWVRTSLLQGALVNGTFGWLRAEWPTRPGFRMWVTDPRVPHGFFQTKDGRWVHNWAPQPTFVLNVAAGNHLEITDEVRALKADSSRVSMDPEEVVALRAFLQPMREAFARFTSSDWVQVAAAAGVSVQPMRSPEESLHDPLFLADGCVVEVEDPEVGPIRHVGITYHLHAAPGAVRGPAPSAGEHTARVLGELASGTLVPEPHPASMPGTPLPELSRTPLQGIVVLDVGLAVAGPFGTQMLADLGADVIKISRPGDQVWHDTCMAMSCNRGKRSISVDLKSRAGMDVLRHLIRRADILHTNMRYDAAEHLGIDYASLQAINPRMIYCHTRGFENGPRMLLPGHDQSGSALAGVGWEEGGLSAGGKPIWPLISLGDLGNGMLSAIAVLQALYHRDRTGEGQFVDTAIVYAQLLNASSAWVSADGERQPDRPRLDAEQLGLTALYRLYPTMEGWICIAVVTDEHWRCFARVMAGSNLSQDERFSSPASRWAHDAELSALLEPIFASRSAHDWVELLDASGVPAEVSSDTFGLNLFDDPELRAKGWITTLDQPLVGKIDMIGRTIDFSETPGRIVRPPLVSGQDTCEILAELGYESEAVAKLLAEGVVAAPEPPRAGSRQFPTTPSITDPPGVRTN